MILRPEIGKWIFFGFDIKVISVILCDPHIP